MLRTRSPRAHPVYCYTKLRVRLACVKHAASVRSEPGSNSHLKLVSCESRFRLQLAPQRNSIRKNELVTSLGFTQTLSALTRKQGKPNGFWHVSFDCQRAEYFLACRKETDNRRFYQNASASQGKFGGAGSKIFRHACGPEPTRLA